MLELVERSGATQGHATQRESDIMTQLFGRGWGSDFR
jgi:hypothetical protein